MPTRLNVMTMHRHHVLLPVSRRSRLPAQILCQKNQLLGQEDGLGYLLLNFLKSTCQIAGAFRLEEMLVRIG